MIISLALVSVEEQILFLRSRGRTDIPRLLATVEAQAGEIAELRKRLATSIGFYDGVYRVDYDRGQQRWFVSLDRERFLWADGTWSGWCPTHMGFLTIDAAFAAIDAAGKGE